MIEVNTVIFNYFIKHELNLSQEISVYVHWPFCKSKCPYCDFNSHVRNSIDVESFINAYLKEISYYQAILNGKQIRSIFFGGGTPSLAPAKFFIAILDKLSSVASFSQDIEITLEANPTSVEAANFKDYAAAGINRVSIGVQSLNPEQLKFLDREHSKTEAEKAISNAAKYFSRYNFDLIYALPNQTISVWKQELQYALSLAEGHLSLYQLTIEKGTKFYGDFQKKKFIMPDQDQAADFYEVTQEIMEKHGMPAYEISNHARPGQESIHNLTYWEYGDYIGIGAGAHGRYLVNDKKYATVNAHLPEDWLKTINENGNALLHQSELSCKVENQERVLMGLRLNKGIDKHYLSGYKKLQDLLVYGHLEEKDGKIKVSKKDRLVLNTVISELVE